VKDAWIRFGEQSNGRFRKSDFPLPFRIAATPFRFINLIKKSARKESSIRVARSEIKKLEKLYAALETTFANTHLPFLPPPQLTASFFIFFLSAFSFALERFISEKGGIRSRWLSQRIKRQVGKEYLSD